MHEGDCIVAIGGKRLSRDVTPDRLLVNAAGRDISVTLRSKKGEERTVLGQGARERSRAALPRVGRARTGRIVHERTGERVGYVHIPDMGPWGFAEFHRGYLSEFDRKGLDRRRALQPRRPRLAAAAREARAQARRLRHAALRCAACRIRPSRSGGPMVALTNQFAGSDGDIFSHCFKLYKLGPLVGKRTWGGVIGIDPYHHLVDGTLTTQPEFSFWFVDVGWRVENYGTDPDYDVDIAPHEYRDGKDPQLDLALRADGSRARRLRRAAPGSLHSPVAAVADPGVILGGAAFAAWRRSSFRRSSTPRARRPNRHRGTRRSCKAFRISSASRIRRDFRSTCCSATCGRTRRARLDRVAHERDERRRDRGRLRRGVRRRARVRRERGSSRSRRRCGSPSRKTSGRTRRVPRRRTSPSRAPRSRSTPSCAGCAAARRSLVRRRVRARAASAWPRIPNALWILPAFVVGSAARAAPRRRFGSSQVARARRLRRAALYAYLPLRSAYVVAHGLDPTAALAGAGGGIFWNYNDPRTLHGLAPS